VFAYINGMLVKESLHRHTLARSATTGEVNANCTGMFNYWANATESFSNLQYHRASTNAWYRWAEQYDITNNANCYVASRVNGETGTACDHETLNQGCP